MYRHRTMVGGLRTSEREKDERGRVRELRGGFQLVGRLCAARSREQCRQDYLPPPFLYFVFTSSQYTAARLKTTLLFVLQSSFSADSHRGLPLPIALCFFLFVIESRDLSRSVPYLLRLIIKFLSAYIRCFFPPISTSIDYCSLSHLRSIVPFAFTVTHPSIAFAFM